MGFEFNKNRQLITGYITTNKILFFLIYCLFLFIPVAKSPSIIAGVSALAIWFLSGKFIKDRRKWLGQKWILPVLAFLILPWAGLLWTEDPRVGIKFAKSSYLWFFPLMIASIDSNGTTKKESLLKAFLIGLSFTALLSIMQFLGVLPKKNGLPIGLLSGLAHGTLSLFLVFGILIMSFYFKNVTTKRAKLLTLMLLVFYCIDLSVVQGRTGLLAFILLSPIIMYNLLDTRHILFIVLASISILVFFAASPTVRKRMDLIKTDIEQYSKGNPDTSIGARFYMWKFSKEIIIEHPIIGAGTGGFKILWKTNKPDKISHYFNTPHNTFLSVASSFGLIGLVPLIWLFITLFRFGLYNQNNIMGFSVLIFSLVFFVGSFTNTLVAGFTNTAWVASFLAFHGSVDNE